MSKLSKIIATFDLLNLFRMLSSISDVYPPQHAATTHNLKIPRLTDDMWDKVEEYKQFSRELHKIQFVAGCCKLRER